MSFEDIHKLTSLFIKDFFQDESIFDIENLTVSSISNFEKFISSLKIDDMPCDLPLFIENYPIFKNNLNKFNISYELNEKYINKLKELKFGDTFIKIPKQRRRSTTKILLDFSYDSDLFNSDGELCKTVPKDTIKFNYISSDDESIISPKSYTSFKN